MTKPVLTALIDRVTQLDAALGDELATQVKVATEGREFGLVFNRHVPETVELPGRKVRVNDKVRFRLDDSETTWLVTKIEQQKRRTVAHLLQLPRVQVALKAPVSDLVVVADFRDSIYPGLRSLGVVDNDSSGRKPTHAVINAENHHALRALSFAYTSKVDCIYIDPPYNTGGKASWLYNDNYVDETDPFKSAKWLAFMERRLKIAKNLLKPSGVLFVSIGDDEQHRLRMLMDQIFEAQNCVAVLTVEMSTTSGPKTVNAQQGTIVKNSEFVLVYKRSAEFDTVKHTPLLDGIDAWDTHYSYWLQDDGKLGSLGEQLMANEAVRDDVGKFGIQVRSGRVGMKQMDKLVAVSEAASTFINENLSRIARVDRPPVSAEGIRVPPGRWKEFEAPDRRYFLTQGSSGGLQQLMPLSLNYRMSDDYRPRFGRTVIRGDLWRGFHQDMGNVTKEGGIAFDNGKKPVRLIKQLIRWANNAPDAVVLDFFGGSGTTTHAVMEMNAEDGGRRQSILVTNNEVNRDAARRLRREGQHKGDADWETQGIFRKVTRPRIETVVSGVRPDGSQYSQGLQECVEFFDLTYEDGEAIRVDMAFEAVAPLLWLRAGGHGVRIDHHASDYSIADRYAVLFDPDKWKAFTRELEAIDGLRSVFVVTDEDNVFQAVADRLPVSVDKVRLYESYLRTFMFGSGAE